MSEWKECPKCHCMNLNREMCQDCWRDLKDVAAEKPTPPITAEAKPDCAPLGLLDSTALDAIECAERVLSICYTFDRHRSVWETAKGTEALEKIRKLKAVLSNAAPSCGMKT